MNESSAAYKGSDFQQARLSKRLQLGGLIPAIKVSVSPLLLIKLFVNLL
jgi:hypothetical protein